MKIRFYEPGDCAEMAQLFYDTVHAVNRKDYSPVQLNVWATGMIDLAVWNQSFISHTTLVAVQDQKILGFADMDESGYLDRLYVHKDYQGKGIATLLCDLLESMASTHSYVTHASITARPFFEKRGYKVLKEQEVERGGILLTNYVMEKNNLCEW